MDDREENELVDDLPDMPVEDADTDSEEKINDSDHDSQSEQSGSDDETGESPSEFEFYVGKGAQNKKNQDESAFKWRKQPFKPTKVKKKNIINFHEGLTETSQDIRSEFDAFAKMLDGNMMETIVRCTNLVIRDVKRTGKNKHRLETICCDEFIFFFNFIIPGAFERDRDCQETSMSEILALVGTLYLIGLKQSSHTNVSELWTTDGTGVPLLRCIMSSRRFLFLLRCLRFDDRSTRKERRKLDKLAAIREIYDAFVDNCKKNYVPGVSMTIDEMLWGFRGRCGFLQYMEGKPAKIGIKVQILADAFEFYVQNLEIYCGQQPEGPYRVSNKSADIVKRLVEPLEGSNRNITTDNWYTSPTLARDLLKEGLTCYGTMKKNKREIPPEFLPSKSRELNSTIFGFQKDMMLASYATKKNKAVIMLSTLHDQPEINAITGKPEVIMDYNTTKGGVDTVDKMAAAYSVSRITRMWPQAIFHIFLNIAGINAQVLYFASEGAEPCRRRFFFEKHGILAIERAFASSIKDCNSSARH